MNREKKQMAVLGALALMIVCVGAFQFMGGSPEPIVAEPTKKVEKNTDKSEDGVKKGPKNPEFATPLGKKDPFQIAPFAFSAPEEPKPPVQETTKPPPLPAVGKGGGIPDYTGVLPAGGLEPAIVPEVPKFTYRLVGVIEGKFPSAVFADANGNQRLVEIGQQVGSSATVLSISRGKVRVKFNAEVLTLSVGGNSSAK